MSSKPNQSGLIPDKGPTLIVLLIVGGVVALALVAWYLDSRLDSFETLMGNQPPGKFEPFDLTEFSAAGVDPATLTDPTTIYVPVHSHIYHEGGTPVSLETMLSIRNISPNDTIFVSMVRYFDTSGELKTTFVDRLIQLGPLQTVEFLVPRSDHQGGSGANFLVQWHVEKTTRDPTPAPLIEALMAGTLGTRALSFRATGIETDAPH